MPAKYYPEILDPTHATASAIIPDGYRIGFMIRKDNGNKTENMGNDKRGCLYGCGELNTEINTFGQFKSSVELYGMELNDPRMATFTANGKTYLCFEEGADTQYSDVIIEIGGVSTTQVRKAIAEEPDDSNKETIIDDDNNEGESGVYLFDEIEEIPGIAYTMCFEDRPETADYDLNDLVLRCVYSASEPDVVQLSIVAIGASDNLYIEGIDGKPLSGERDLMAQEVHEYFHVENLTGEERFVNTLEGKAKFSPVGSFYRMNTKVTLPQFLSKIVLRNGSTGRKIKSPQKGKEPSALIIPGDFNYPKEYHSILNAYTDFKSWAQNVNLYKDWMEFENLNEVYSNPYGE